MSKFEWLSCNSTNNMQHAKISNTCKPQVVSTSQHALKITNSSSEVRTRHNIGCNIALMWCFARPPLALTRDFLMQIKREWVKKGSGAELSSENLRFSTLIQFYPGIFVKKRKQLMNKASQPVLWPLFLKCTNKSACVPWKQVFIIDLLHWAQIHCQYVPTVTQTHSLHRK